MAKLKSGTRIYGTATIDTSVVVGSVVTLSSSGIQSNAQITSTGTVSGTNITTGGNVTGSSASVANAVTFNNGGSGAVSGTTFNGSAAQTISYNTLGASPLAGSSSLTTTGTVTSGTWSGSFGAVSGANLTSLTAGNLSGTIPSAVLGNSTAHVGTTAIVLNRASANQALTGILSVAMPGSTSGTITVQPTAVAGTNTITLPASTGTVALTSDLGNGTLTMAVSGTGLSGSASFTANQSSATTFTVTSNATNANTASTIVARDASGNFSAGTITAVGLTLSGDLTVNGTTTTINSTTLSVDDKNIELGSVTTPTNATADGGGITLKGATDKTLNWLSATGAWTSSEDFNLATGKIYAIAGTTVLSSTQVLGKSLPSGVVVGTTDTQTLTNKTIAAGSNTISGLTNTNLSGTAGITNANLANSTISGVALGSNLNTLTMNVSGTGLSGSTTYNGSAAATFTVTINATNANTASTIVARDASGNFSAGTITASLTGAASLNVLKAGDTMTGQLISTLANNTATGGGQIYLNGATGNRIDFTTNGIAAPATTTRSVGTKIVLYPGVSASTVDYAFGMDSNTLWFSIANSTPDQFKWYAGTTNIATLTGTGALSVTGTVSGTNITTGGNVTGSSASVANAVTFNNGGAGDASGTTFNGSAARTISYNTLGASPLAGSSSLTTTGTVTSGTWSGSFGAVSGANLTSLNASNLGSGTVPTARLGTGTANNTTYLRGDNTWATVTSGSITVSDDTSTNAVRYPIFEDVTSGTSTTINVSSTKLTFNPSTGVLSATGFSGSGANLTSLPAGNLSGTIPSAVLGNSTAHVGTTAIVLNRASANQALSGISSVVMPGSTSGTITLQPTAVAGTNTITLPASTGTVALTSDLGNGTLSMSVSGTGLSGSASFTANQSGNSTFTVTSNATNANTASTIVARDASGNFSAGTITANLTGTASNVTTNANLAGDVTSVGNTTSIAAGVIVDADINGSAGIVDTKLATISTAGKVSNSATTATSANTASAIVARDASGNFSAGTITAAALTVSGDLTVNGTTTTINSTTLSVDDKNIELGSVASPTNTTADGGGITLRGTTDKTLNWLNATGAWTSSEDFNLVAGKIYTIAGTSVLSSTQVLGKTLPSGVVVGTTDTQTLTNKTISGSSNTLSNIANASLTNSTISGIALGSNLNTLTMNVSGTGLSGSTTYNGSAAATFTVTSNATSAATANTVLVRDSNGAIVTNGYHHQDYTFEKIFDTSAFQNGASNVPNQAIDIRIPNSNNFWGWIEVSLTSSYNYANSPGKLTKLFAIGINGGGNIYATSTRIVDAIGPIVSNFAIGDFSWDSTNSVYKIPISHIVGSSNGLTIIVKAYSYGGTATIYNGLTLGPVYTLTALAAQVPSYDGNLNIGGTATANADFRAPIFYDSNDTAYYVNPAGGNARISRDLYISGYTGGNYGNRLIVGNTDTSYTLQDTNIRPTIQTHGAYPVVSLNHTVTSNASHGPTLQFTCNGTGNQFVIGTNGTGTQLDIGTSASTDWNPHNGINNYSGTTGFRMDTSANVYNFISTRSPIFYDSGNTAYYTDPASTSNLNALTVNSTFTVNNGWSYVANNYGYGIVGLYSASVFQLVFAMGDAYKTTAAGGINNLYGIAWSHPNAGGIAANLNTHGALITENGAFLAALSGSIRCRDDMRAPIYYDSNNTGYYVDPASTSILNVIGFNGTSANAFGSYWAGGAGYPAYQFTGGNSRFGFSSTGGVVDVYADGNFYATDSSHLVLHAGNYNSYSPTLTGTGASGSWGISVTGSSASCTGNAATATNASTLNSISAVNLFNNMGDGHGTRSSFDASSPSYGFGFRFVQGNGNGPATGGGSQFYSWYQGLGSDYAATGGGSYGMYIAIPRTATTPYMSVRYNENNSLGSWIKIAAGFADSAPFDGLTSKASGTGTYTTSGDFRAPIFYDSDSTAYYINPLGTSNLNNCTAIRYLARASGISLGTGNSAQLEINNAANGACNISFHREGAYGAHFGLDTDNVFSTLGWSAGAGYTGMRVGGLTVMGGFSVNGTGTATTDFRAPIFYDSNNTGYYTDPLSTSNLNNVQVTTFGVGTAASGTTGEIRATNNITAYYSDERLKENITTISGALSKLLTLRGVTFNSNKIAEQYGYTDKKEQVGVIAQDVEKVLPQVVVPAPFDIAQDEDGNEYSKSGENYKTVHYDKLVPLLIEAIKELKGEIEELKSKIPV